MRTTKDNMSKFIYDQTQLVINNLDLFANRADGKFINAHPKEKRWKKDNVWTAEKYKAQIYQWIEDFWRNPEGVNKKYHKCANSVFQTLVKAIVENSGQAYRDLWGLMRPFDIELTEKDKALREKRRKVVETNESAKQRDVLCTTTFLPIYYRSKETGVQFRDDKKTRKEDECCQCHRCKRLRAVNEKNFEIAKAAKARQDAIEKARKEKKRRLHGTET